MTLPVLRWDTDSSDNITLTVQSTGTNGQAEAYAQWLVDFFNTVNWGNVSVNQILFFNEKDGNAHPSLRDLTFSANNTTGSAPTFSRSGAVVTVSGAGFSGSSHTQGAERDTDITVGSVRAGLSGGVGNFAQITTEAPWLWHIDTSNTITFAGEAPGERTQAEIIGGIFNLDAHESDRSYAHTVDFDHSLESTDHSMFISNGLARARVDTDADTVVMELSIDSTISFTSGTGPNQWNYYERLQVYDQYGHLLFQEQPFPHVTALHYGAKMARPQGVPVRFTGLRGNVRSNSLKALKPIRGSSRRPF